MNKAVIYAILFTSGSLVIKADKKANNLILSTQNASAYINPLTFNEQKLTTTAEVYGNKTANLIELKEIAPFLSQTTGGQLTFAVPSFFGISNLEIINYLKSLPSNENTVWETLLKHWKLFNTAQSSQKETLSDNAKIHLFDIRELLGNTEFNIDNIVTDQMRHEELINFLQNTTQKGELLMVRSTGREDGKDLSNAGGNSSIASVAPNQNAISSAIQEVLQSYFSEKSIGQRLLGNDNRLFDEEPFMAILLQTMVGEIYGVSQEIPRSGVMFSPEAEGETPHVVVIQATYGHNEGVVNGLVPVDTYYIGPSELVHPLISIKAKRLSAFPNQPGLEFVDNSPEQKTASTLDKPTVLQLKNAARAIQDYYNNPVDIEFVLLNNTVYLVQARPLENKKFEASFLSNRFIAQNQSSTISVIPFGTGNSAVRIITHPDQVIITDNIRRALELFLAKPADTPQIQAVIVGEYGIKNSHEATQFRRLGIPTLYASDVEAVKTLLKKTAIQTGPSAPVSSSTSSKPIEYSADTVLIDTQSALITPFIPTSDFTTPTQAIELGWHSHPIEKKVSLIADFFPKLPEAVLKELTPQEFFANTPTTSLLDIIKNENPEQVNRALKSLIYRIQNTIKKMELTSRLLAKTQSQTHAKIIPQLKHIFICMVASAQEINETLKNSDVQRLERLYPVVFLEALLRQIPEPLRMVNDYSLSSLIKTEILEQRKVAELQLQGKTMRAHIVQYSKADEGALIPEIKNHFDTYLKNLAEIKNQELQNQYAQLMLNLSKLNITQPWLNTSFERFYNEFQGNTEELTQKLIEDFRLSQNVLQYIQPIDEFFSNFNPAVFEQPASFEKQFKALTNAIDKATDPNLLENINTTTNSGKIAFLQLMHKTVSSFDAAIKALTGSPEYEKNFNLKIDRFKKMLTMYFHLLRKWIEIPAINKELEDRFDTRTFKNLTEYLENIRSALDTTTKEPHEFQPSANFNVSGTALGSRGSWRFNAPNKLTLEDVFTLIHQNLLVIEGIFANTTDLKNMKTPELITHFRNKIMNTAFMDSDRIYGRTQLGKVDLVGIMFDNDNLKYIYNIPLQDHGVNFELIYNLNTKKSKLFINFFGGDENYRLTNIAHTIYLLNSMHAIPPVSSLEYDPARRTLSFTLDIDTINQAEQAMAYLYDLIGLTFYGMTKHFVNLIINKMVELSPVPNEAIQLVATTIHNELKNRPSLITFALRLANHMPNEEEYKAYVTKLFSMYSPLLPQNKQISILNELFDMLQSDDEKDYPAQLVIILINTLLDQDNVQPEILKAVSIVLGYGVNKNSLILNYVVNNFLKSDIENKVIFALNILGLEEPFYYNTPGLLELAQVTLNNIDRFLDSENPDIKTALTTLTKKLTNIKNNNTFSETDAKKIADLELRFVPKKNDPFANYDDSVPVPMYGYYDDFDD